MDSDLQDRIDRLEALVAIQAADISSLVAVLSECHAVLQPHLPDMPDPAERFLAWRRTYLHGLLEQIETHDPARAARIQALIDQNTPRFPFDYE